MNAATALLLLRLVNMLAAGLQISRALRTEYEGFRNARSLFPPILK